MKLFFTPLPPPRCRSRHSRRCLEVQRGAPCFGTVLGSRYARLSEEMMKYSSIFIVQCNS